MTTKKLISFLIPVYNEEDNVGPAHERVCAVMAPLAGRYDFELLFTDNHSEDATFERLEALARKDARVRVIRFSRNFGYQRSIHAGYARAKGAAAIQLDCDLQDPPDLVPEFLRLWEAGNQVVYGVRSTREGEPLMSLARKTFYRLIDALSEDELPHDAGDFRLVDRRVIEELLKMEDSQPYLRGALASVGFTQIGVPYDRAARERGSSKFAMGDLFGLALDGIMNHSIVPLRLATYVGLAVSLATFLALLGYTAGRIFFGRSWPAGFATTTALILLSLSLNAVFFGIIGEYVGRIYKQVKRRPLVIVEKEL